MSWIITNDKNFIKANPGKVETVSNINYATFFESQIKAQNFVSNLPKVMKNLGYYAYEIIEEVEEKKDLDLHETKIFYQKTDKKVELYKEIGEFDNIVDVLTKYEQFVNRVLSNEGYLNAKLILIEKEQTDIEHAIEFYNLNACEGFKMYKKLKDIRIKRRKIKDSLTIINILKESFSNLFFESPPSKRVEGIKNRKYRPRALKELFDCD